MADLTPEERAAAERKKVLKKFGLLEADLRSLRSLDNEETIWRVEHEYKNGCEFLRRRADFMLSECIVPDPKKRPKDPNFVQPHRDFGKEVKQTGVKVG